MKRIFVVVLLLLLIISCQISKSEKGVYVLNERFFFDTIMVGKSINSTFYVKNETNIPVIVDTILLSCECVELVFAFDTLYPGCIDSLIVSFKSKEEGHFSRGVSVSFKNDNRIIYGFIEGCVYE